VTGVRLVLARHGRTAANVGHVLDSRPPGSPLDERGTAQARDLAARLANGPVRAVHASRAVRAQQTAAPVAATHGLPVQVLDGVQEVFLGDLEGRSDADALAAFDAVYAAWWRGDLDARVPGGESAAEVRARFVPVVEQLTTEAADGDVVLVSHGAAIRLVAAALLGDTAETFYVPNAGLVVLRADPAGWVLESWDRGRPVRGDVTAGGTPDVHRQRRSG
jgi:broad specificity phosphatase PhoE